MTEHLSPPPTSHAELQRSARYDVPEIEHEAASAMTFLGRERAIHWVPVVHGERMAACSRIIPGPILFVYMHGAIRPEVDEYPRFDRVTSLSRLDVPFLSFADPTLDHHRDLALAWFLGTSEWDPIGTMVEVVERARVEAGASRVITLGGSGGGFAALRLAAHLPGSLAFVYNPQTVLSMYPENVVLPYLQATHPEGMTREDLEDDAARFNMARHYSEMHPRNAVYYLQNLTDAGHIQRHYRPMKRGLQVTKAEGVSPDGLTKFVLFDSERIGHKPPDNVEFEHHIQAARAFYSDALRRMGEDNQT